MDKILIRQLPNKLLNGRLRLICLIECPDCSIQREVRFDSFKLSETTCCRSCSNLRRPTKSKEELFNGLLYRRSDIGRLAHIYTTQRSRCLLKGWPLPTYTQQELIDWGMTNPKYLTIYAAWKDSNYLKNLTPSIDRLDDYISYCFSNIRIVTWGVNNIKGHSDTISGNNTKRSKAVDQLSISGVFIRRFFSIADVSRKLSINKSHIGEVCSGRPIKKGGITRITLTAGGFKWRYSTVPNKHSIPK